jgi:hypothetical protein
MKIFLLFVFLTSLCIASQDTAVVRFVNGDQLEGNAVDLKLDTLTWESALLKDQARFKLDRILDLQLPGKLNGTPDQAAHEAVLDLTNGDTARGRLVGLNDHEIRLNTQYAGEMVFSKQLVKAIHISRNSKVLYRGPLGLNEWTLSGAEGSWKYEDKALVCAGIGGIARDIDFTNEVKISFDLTRKGATRSKFILFTSDIKTPNPKSGYEISFHGSRVRIKRLGEDLMLGSKMIARRVQSNETTRMDIRVSRRTKKIMVFIDEQLCGVWQDEALDRISGKGLMFASDMSHECSISNILVTEWDGFVDESMSQEMMVAEQMGNFQIDPMFSNPKPPAPNELPEGRMMLSNGDTIEGEVIGIEGEMIKIKTPFTDVIFPVHRINNIALKKTDPMPTPKLYNGDVKAILADGSTLVFRLEDVKDGKLVGYSQNFGRAEFLQSAFKRIQFNLYPKSR